MKEGREQLKIGHAEIAGHCFRGSKLKKKITNLYILCGSIYKYFTSEQESRFLCTLLYP